MFSIHLHEGWIGRWSPGIGDPTVLGWVTVAAYLVGAVACWRAARLAAAEVVSGAAHSSDKFWRVATLGLFGLGLNKQLDLQTALTEVGRILAREQGWYDDRRKVQAAFIVLVMAAVLLSLLWLLRVSRRDMRRLRLAILGAGGLAAFVAIRASSFHHVDKLIGTSLMGLRINGWLELGGIGCVAFAALRFGKGASAWQEPAPRSG